MAGRGEQTRAAMLDAGVELVGGASIAELLGFLRPADIAAGAGRSKSTFFHHWPSIGAYIADLLAWVTLQPDREPVLKNTADMLAAGELDPDPLAFVAGVRSVCLAAFDGLSSDPRLALQFLGPVSGDQRVHRALRREYTKMDELGGWLIDEYIERTGQRIREPFTGASIARTVNALLLGMALRSRFDPERATAMLFADVVTALLPVLLLDADSHHLPFDQFVEEAMMRPVTQPRPQLDDLGVDLRPDGPLRPYALEALEVLRTKFVPTLDEALERELTATGTDHDCVGTAHLWRLHDLAVDHSGATIATIGTEAARRLGGDSPWLPDVIGESGLLHVTRRALLTGRSRDDLDEFSRSAIIWVFRVAVGLDGITPERVISMLMAG